MRSLLHAGVAAPGRARYTETRRSSLWVRSLLHGVTWERYLAAAPALSAATESRIHLFLGNPFERWCPENRDLVVLDRPLLQEAFFLQFLKGDPQ